MNDRSVISSAKITQKRRTQFFHNTISIKFENLSNTNATNTLQSISRDLSVVKFYCHSSTRFFSYKITRSDVVSSPLLSLCHTILYRAAIRGYQILCTGNKLRH